MSVYTEPERIDLWRLECLMDAGFTVAISTLLADALHVDLRQAIKMLDQGCPEELVLKILI